MTDFDREMAARLTNLPHRDQLREALNDLADEDGLISVDDAERAVADWLAFQENAAKYAARQAAAADGPSFGAGTLSNEGRAR